MTDEEKAVVAELLDLAEETIDGNQAVADIHPDLWYDWWFTINKGRALIGLELEDLSDIKDDADAARGTNES